MILIDKYKFEDQVDHLRRGVKTRAFEADIDVLDWLKSECSQDWTGYLVEEKIIEEKIKEIELDKIRYGAFEEFDEVLYRSNQISRLEWVFTISEPVINEKSQYERVRIVPGVMDFDDEEFKDFPDFHS